MSGPCNGWIKLYRDLKNKAFYKKDSEMVHLWIHLLMRANFSQNQEEYLGAKLYKCAPGEFTTGRRQLALETGINASKVERCLTYFEKIEQQIEQRKTRQNRLIIIKNWHRYQQIEPQIEPQVNHDRTTSEPQVNHDRTTNEQPECLEDQGFQGISSKKVNTQEGKKERRKEINTILSGKPDDKGKKNNNIDYHWFMESWNNITECSCLSPLIALTPERKAKIKTRCNKNKHFKELFTRGLEKIPSVPFLNGENNTNWRISFDFLVHNDTNILKILEGKYDKKEVQTQHDKEMREHEEFMAKYRKGPQYEH